MGGGEGQLVAMASNLMATASTCSFLLLVGGKNNRETQTREDSKIKPKVGKERVSKRVTSASCLATKVNPASGLVCL